MASSRRPGYQGPMVAGEANPDGEVLRAIVGNAFTGLS
jgi:hypothetical protein